MLSITTLANKIPINQRGVVLGTDADYGGLSSTARFVLDCEGDDGDIAPVKTKHPLSTLSCSTLSKFLTLLAYKSPEHLNTSLSP
jgi:hypothetical protein